MQITARYHFQDKGWRRLVSAVSKLHSQAVEVGILGADGMKRHPNRDTGDITVWEIGAINEFGSQDGHTPERSFLRSTFQDRSWVKSITALAARRVVLFGQSATTAMSWMGTVAVHAVRQKIQNYIAPPNAGVTIAKKGFDHPLVETGTLRDSISYQITGSRSPGAVDIEHFLPGED